MRSRWPISVLCIASGLFILLMGFDVIEVEPSKKHAPDSVISLCGLVFIIAGIMALFGQRSRFNDLLAAILCSLFGIVGAWASIFSRSEDISGGLPFVSHETNVLIGRVLFGVGALMCFAIAAWAVSRFRRPTE